MIRNVAHLFLCSIMLVHAASEAQDLLTRKQVLGGKASMLVPAEFAVMDEETVARKYPVAGHRPTEVYTNEDGAINVALNYTRNAAKESDLEEVKKTMDAQFQRPPIDFINSEIKEINGRKFIILEFISPAADTKIYNLMGIASLEGRLVMITFNCTAKYMKEWKGTGKKIIESIEM